MKPSHPLVREFRAMFAATLGISLVDFMKTGLARLLRHAPDGFRRELSVDSEGRLVDRDIAPEPADDDEQRGIEEEAKVAFQSLAERAQALQAEQSFFGAQLASARTSLADRLTERVSALGYVPALPPHDGASGALAATGTVVPSVVPVILLYAFALVVIAADGANIAAPLADAAGVDMRDGLGAAFRAQPTLSVAALVGGFAVAGAIGIAFRSLLRMHLPAGATPIQLCVFAWRWTATAAISVLVGVAVGRMRHATAMALLSDLATRDPGAASPNPTSSWVIWAALTEAACFFAGWICAAAERLSATRRERVESRRVEEAIAQRARDAEARLAQGDRLLATQLHEAQSELAGIARQREVLADRARALLRDIQERRSRAERRDATFVRFVRAELETDRAAWIRHAPRAARREQGAGLLLLVVTALAAAGCASQDRHEPVHVATIVAGPPARSAAVSAEFETWVAEALDRPDSTFEAFGADGRRSFAVCVPRSWGPGVIARRAAFVRSARARFSDADERSDVDACRSGPVASGVRVVIALPGLSYRGELDASGAEQLHVVIVCDRSSSGLGETRQSCDETSALAVYDEWAIRALPGSTIELIVPGTDAASARSMFRERAAGTNRVLELIRLLARRAAISGALPAEGGSAVAETIEMGGRILMERRGMRELDVASDGRQISGRAAGSAARAPLDPVNFERAVTTPPERFVALMRERAILPRLAGVVVHHCGVHSEVGPRSTALDPRAAADLRAAWTAYYAAAGAPGVELTTDCRDSFFRWRTP